MNVDDWFKKIRRDYASQMQCGKGCTACCHGLFDISLADAADVARGFQQLSTEVQNQVLDRAAGLYDIVREAVTEPREPVLFSEDDPRIDHIIDKANNPPCPFLGNAGECLIYEHRPLSCRLEGVPMVDIHDGLFGDWCELNFTDGIPEAAKPDLAQDYDVLEENQEMRSAAIARRAQVPDHSSVTFIPSVIAEYESFWKRLVS